MTLAELKTRSETAGFNYAYGSFLQPTSLPHLVAYERESNNFFADSVTYKKITPIKMDFSYEKKDLSLEALIENSILYDIPWQKSEEAYFENEKFWQVSYYFEIL